MMNGFVTLCEGSRRFKKEAATSSSDAKFERATTPVNKEACWFNDGVRKRAVTLDVILKDIGVRWARSLRVRSVLNDD